MAFSHFLTHWQFDCFSSQSVYVSTGGIYLILAFQIFIKPTHPEHPEPGGTIHQTHPQHLRLMTGSCLNERIWEIHKHSIHKSHSAVALSEVSLSPWFQTEEMWLEQVYSWATPFFTLFTMVDTLRWPLKNSYWHDMVRIEVKTIVLHLNILSNISLLWTVWRGSIIKRFVQKIFIFKKTTVVAFLFFFFLPWTGQTF